MQTVCVNNGVYVHGTLCCHLLVSTYLSSVAARMYLPLGENLTNDTGGLSSSGKYNSAAVTQIFFIYTLREGGNQSLRFLSIR